MHKEPDLKGHLERIEARKNVLKDNVALLLSHCVQDYKVLEIGSGHGDFLVDYAGKYPDRFCLGIDLISKRIDKSTKKAERHQVDNAYFLKAKAEEFLDCLPEKFLFNEIIILYPDPWPKRRHHKNRLFQENFLSQLARCVTLGARLHFETDAKDYFDETCELVTQHAQWKLDENQQSTYVVDTFFSRVTGESAYHAVFARL